MEVAAGKNIADIQSLAGYAAKNNIVAATSITTVASCASPAANELCVNNPPTEGPHTGDSNYVEAILSQPAPSIFPGLVNYTTAIAVNTRAVAGLNSSSSACVLALATSGTDITISGNTSPDLSNCSVNTNSTDPSSVQFNGNPSHLTAYTIVTSGNINPTYPNGHLTLTKAPTTGAAATQDPYAGASHTMPSLATCLAATSTPMPGNCYKGISLTGSHTFIEGVYYVAGTGTIGSTQFAISGNGMVTAAGGVTIVLFNGADVSITGTPTVTLSAPTSGTWQGILFWQDKASTPLCPGGSTCSTITGTATTTLTGALYLPQDNFSFSGNSGSTCTVLIANTVSFQGTPAMSAAGCAAAGVTPPTTSSTVVLVE
jgi:hypothetical protein